MAAKEEVMLLKKEQTEPMLVLNVWQITDMWDLYISLGSVFKFMLR